VCTPGFGGGDGHVEFHVGGVDESQGVNEIATGVEGVVSVCGDRPLFSGGGVTARH
jgi:hypothetical protein